MRTKKMTALAVVMAAAATSGCLFVGCADVDCSAAGTCNEAAADGSTLDATMDAPIGDAISAG